MHAPRQRSRHPWSKISSKLSRRAPADVKERKEAKALQAQAWQCEVCQVRFSALGRIIDHIKKHHVSNLVSGNISCPACPSRRAFLHKESVYKHFLNKHAGWKTVRCRLCKIDLRPSEARPHVGSQHADININDATKDGPRSGGSSSSSGSSSNTRPTPKTRAVAHPPVVQMHTEETPTKTSRAAQVCALCHDSFSQPWRLRRHMEQRHAVPSKAAPPAESRDLPTEKNTCRVCLREFQAISNLRRHEQASNHRSGIPNPVRMPCDICGKVLWQLENLVPHVKQAHPEQYYDWCWKEEDEWQEEQGQEEEA